MADQKDRWDKIEIIGKVALPVVIALATLFYNGQLNQRQRDAAMVQIAVGVVSTDPSEDQPQNALRDWAIERLEIHGDLSAEAAAELRQSALPRSNVALVTENTILELRLKDARCREIQRSIVTLQASVALKQENRRLAAKYGEEPLYLQTHVALDQAALTSARAELITSNCPEQSTETFVDNLLAEYGILPPAQDDFANPFELEPAE